MKSLEFYQVVVVLFCTFEGCRSYFVKRSIFEIFLIFFSTVYEIFSSDLPLVRNYDKPN